MDKKKLIGTIIGVTMFAALIAGATFAWFTIAATNTNATYTTGSRNFVINYGGGSAVTAVKMISSGSATTGNITSETAASVTTDGWIQVQATKPPTTPKVSSFSINLSISTNTLTTKSVVYAVCKGACSTTVALATVSGTGTSTSASCGNGVIACGTIYGTTAIPLYNDATTFNVANTSDLSQTYNIYLWLNSDTLSNNDMGKEFSGYIYASATQGE